MKINAPIMLDLTGTELTKTEKDLLKHPQIGGIIFFTRNYEDKNQLTHLIKSIKQQNPKLILAVDQEGGRIQRFEKEFTRLPALAELGEKYLQDKTNACEDAKAAAITMATELKQLGVDFSFAPVLDINHGISEVISNRSFADNAAAVIELGRAYISGMHKAGMIAVGKHFPGHGAVAADSHVAIPVDDRSYDDIAKTDLLPFQALSQELDGIMPAHVIYDQVDPNPAGFSEFWLQDVLRKQLKFKGIIFSDDMTMQGASVMGDMLERTQAALKAGCDMVLICNDQKSAIFVLDRLK